MKKYLSWWKGNLFLDSGRGRVVNHIKLFLIDLRRYLKYIVSVSWFVVQTIQKSAPISTICDGLRT